MAYILALRDDGSPPTEFMIWPSGWVETSKGRFLFDSKAAESVMADFEKHGNELPLDYAHAMVAPGAGDPALEHRAAGWFRLEVRDGALWAVDVRWTSAASKALSEKEWRYFSPAFEVGPERRISRLINVALTNLPATYGMTPLVASATPEQTIMNPALLLALGLSATASEAEALERAGKLAMFEREVLETLSQNHGLPGAFELSHQGAQRRGGVADHEPLIDLDWEQVQPVDRPHEPSRGFNAGHGARDHPLRDQHRATTQAAERCLHLARALFTEALLTALTWRQQKQVRAEQCREIASRVALGFHQAKQSKPRAGADPPRGSRAGQLPRSRLDRFMNHFMQLEVGRWTRRGRLETTTVGKRQQWARVIYGSREYQRHLPPGALQAARNRDAGGRGH